MRTQYTMVSTSVVGWPDFEKVETESISNHEILNPGVEICLFAWLVYHSLRKSGTRRSHDRQERLQCLISA
jgi:hypothetical protein